VRVIQLRLAVEKLEILPRAILGEKRDISANIGSSWLRAAHKYSSSFLRKIIGYFFFA